MLEKASVRREQSTTAILNGRNSMSFAGKTVYRVR
jgi:hypothetical protein